MASATAATALATSGAHNVLESTLADAGGAPYVPRIEDFDASPASTDGHIRHHIVVLRDVTPSRDEKVVMVMAEVDQAPRMNGVLTKDGIRPNGVGVHLFIPDAYRVTTQIGLHGADAPEPTPVEFSPASDGATERTISEKISVSASSGTSSAATLLTALQKAGTLLDGKIPINVNDSESRTEEYTIGMTLKDYFIESQIRKEHGAQAATWSFTLARDIAADALHFYDAAASKIWSMNNTRRMRPMMRRATLAVSSVWRIPGSYKGPVDITTRANVINRVYIPNEHRTDIDHDGSDIALTTRIDLGSPHLSRQPVVRLQSLTDNGPCLVQPRAGADVIELAPCRGGEHDAGEQWTLELDSTFRNRGSGQCLTADLGSGRLVAQDCAGPGLNQQWQWRADRLHSLYVEGGSWRLHVKNGEPNAMFDPAVHSNVPSNVYHVLLRPWSSYPQAPSLGDVIPNLNSVSPGIPESYLSFGAVPTSERWQPVLVRTGH